jgi:signal transduction histidine kinase/pSer/pThr/pTyr-binding forkhead associated (FHA) protein
LVQEGRGILKRIHVIDGPVAGAAFDVADGVTSVGRSSDNDICIPDIGVSRHHAKLLKKNGKVFVVDLGSRHGVFVNGRKIARRREVEIHEESTVRVGNTVLSFRRRSSGVKAVQQPPMFRSVKHTDKTSELSTAMQSSRNYTRSLELLLKVSNIFSQSLNIDELLGEVIDQIFIVLERIDRGAVLLLDKDKGSLQEVASKTRMEDREGLFSKINYSRTIVNRTLEQAKPVMMSDTSRVDKDSLSNSIEQMNIMSVMCVPLVHRGEVGGVIYVDSIGLPEGFRKDDLQLLTSLSNTAAVALENARLYSNLEQLVEQRTKQLAKTQASLKESESRFRAVFENMSNGVAIFEALAKGADFILKDFNKAAERIDKIKKEDVIGRSVRTVFPGFREYGFLDIFKSVWDTGKPEYHSPMLYKKDDVTSWRTSYVYKLPNGEIVFIYEDITAQKEAIENQQRLERQLSHAQKMESLGRMAGGVAHNFRNILQAIMGNTQFLQMAYGQDEQMQKIAKIMNASVRKGSDFIDSLLKFSRQDIDRGMLPLDLEDVISETNRIISNTFDQKIKITTRVEGPLSIKGDHLSLNQAFINLCNNARDSMPDGGELTIEAKKQNDEVLITISDTGLGMDEETIKNIFDPFYTTKDVGQGTGLGLSITHGIIEEHNGSISVSSQTGKGTKFTISFPVAERFDRIESKSPLKIKRGMGETVLVVDDEPDVLEGLRNMVKAIGYEVESAGSGNLALEQYKKHKPDVVLMDWKMANMDGATCAKEIVAFDPAARVILISGYQEGARNEIEAGLKNIIKDFIVKPFDLKKLSEVFVKALH